MKTVLNVGCGREGKVPDEWASYRQVRVDADPGTEPDILASMVSMPMVKDGSADFLYCSHALEHLYAHETVMAIAEFMRVLKPEGELRIAVPDLQSIGGRLALDQVDVGLYTSPAGPITLLDMIYGHRGLTAYMSPWMAHRTGFTVTVLKRLLGRAGFVKVEIKRESFTLNATALKPAPVAEEPPLAGDSLALDRTSGLERTAAVAS